MEFEAAKMILPITILYKRAFTLVELMIVLVMVAVISAVAVPYSSNSDARFDVQQQCLDIKNYLHFALSAAESQGNKYRFAIDCKDKSYWLEYWQDSQYKAIVGPFGSRKKISSRITAVTKEGFDEENVSYIIYDPTKSWPIANIEIDSVKGGYRIEINAREIEIKGFDETK